MTTISACLVFVAFIICGGIPLTEWLDEKERNIIATLILVGLMWFNDVGENTIPGFILAYLFFVFVSLVCLMISSDDEYRRTHPE